jgi:hypothetical protein
MRHTPNIGLRENMVNEVDQQGQLSNCCHNDEYGHKEVKSEGWHYES